MILLYIHFHSFNITRGLVQEDMTGAGEGGNNKCLWDRLLIQHSIHSFIHVDCREILYIKSSLRDSFEGNTSLWSQKYMCIYFLAICV